MTQYWIVTGTSFTDTGTGGTIGSRADHPGDSWLVKNLFELKNARNVLVERNVFENNWANGQAGYAILFTPRNQEGTLHLVRGRERHLPAEHRSSRRRRLQHPRLRRPAPSQPDDRDHHHAESGSTGMSRARRQRLVRADRRGPPQRRARPQHGRRRRLRRRLRLGRDRPALSTASNSPTTPHGTTTTASTARTSVSGTRSSTTISRARRSAATGSREATASRYPADNLFPGRSSPRSSTAAGGNYHAAAGSILVGRATDGGDIGAQLRR